MLQHPTSSSFVSAQSLLPLQVLLVLEPQQRRHRRPGDGELAGRRVGEGHLPLPHRPAPLVPRLGARLDGVAAAATSSAWSPQLTFAANKMCKSAMRCCRAAAVRALSVHATNVAQSTILTDEQVPVQVALLQVLNAGEIAECSSPLVLCLAACPRGTAAHLGAAFCRADSARAAANIWRRGRQHQRCQL